MTSKAVMWKLQVAGPRKYTQRLSGGGALMGRWLVTAWKDCLVSSQFKLRNMKPYWLYTLTVYSLKRMRLCHPQNATLA